jgi:tRNA threonylcarbamoyladenosine biosynthesis protein TsaB
MSNTLAIDTCFGACSVALRLRGPDGLPQIREDYREMPTGHAEVLVPMIDALVRSSGLRMSDLRRLAVTIGPGSFTGARIGLSAVRGLKLALGLPVVTLTSLTVLAFRAETLIEGGPFPVTRQGAVLVAAMDARAGRIYAEGFGESVAEPLAPAQLCTPAELAATLRGRRIIAVGSGAPMLAEAVIAAGCDAVAILPQLQPHARHLALLADAAPLTFKLDPLYLRDTDAKPMAIQP